MNNEKKRPRTRGKGGRLPKPNPAIRRETVNLDEAGHARFLTMFEQSGLLSKSKFIAARIFNEEFRVIRTDRATMEYVVKLTELFRQFRAIGVNYNQAVKELHIHFTEKKALALPDGRSGCSNEVCLPNIPSPAQCYPMEFPVYGIL